MDEAITTDIVEIFQRYPTTQEATKAMIEKLVADFDTRRYNYWLYI